MTAIVWLRSALRIEDNTALATASRDHDSIVPVHIIDTDKYDEKNRANGYPKYRFWHEAVRDLRRRMRENGHDLVIRDGQPAEELQDLVSETGADAVYTNTEYTPYARNRDTAVANQLSVPFNQLKDHVLVEKQEVTTGSGTPYKVYTYFKKKWFKRDHRRPQDNEPFSVPSVESDPLPRLDAFDDMPPDDFTWQWTPGREGAVDRLEQFKEQIAHYDNLRDVPWRDATSKVSPHVRYGTVSIRELFWEAERLKARFEDTSGIQTWQEELAWHDFYVQVLWNWPETVDEPFLKQYGSIDWHWDGEHEDHWESFTHGKTGFPIVDAGIRQLRTTGWMHNRLRMVTTSFAAKDLHVDWRKLHRFFDRWFVDAALAQMIGGIQWGYSIGTDAQPYFRIFNPWTQGEDYDPDGAFIREMIPELEDIPDQYIHRPYKMPSYVQQDCGCIIGEDYPEPIVDHSTERETALDMFKQARDDD